MVQQLLYDSPVSFQMLCDIAQRTLASSVRRWCAGDATLRGRGYEKDILQEIHIRLIQTAVTGFLLREGEDGPVNLDPAGFRSWMFRVAKNLTKDYSAAVRRVDSKSVSREDIPEEEAEEKSPSEPLLREAVRIVLDGDSSIYISLTWLAQSIFVLHYDLTRIQATHLLEEQFSQRTLTELWNLVRKGAERISWLQITPVQQQRIEQALDRPYDESRSYGQVCYKEFFMKKGGRASISDWIHRIDGIIQKTNPENLV